MKITFDNGVPILNQPGPRGRVIVRYIPISVYERYQEIRKAAAEGRITEESATAQMGTYVMPSVKLRPGVDYEPDVDIIELRVRKAVRSILLP